jgi:hypothetical protein
VKFVRSRAWPGDKAAERQHCCTAGNRGSHRCARRRGARCKFQYGIIFPIKSLIRSISARRASNPNRSSRRILALKHCGFRRRLIGSQDTHRRQWRCLRLRRRRLQRFSAGRWRSAIFDLQHLLLGQSYGRRRMPGGFVVETHQRISLAMAGRGGLGPPLRVWGSPRVSKWCGRGRQALPLASGWLWLV